MKLGKITFTAKFISPLTFQTLTKRKVYVGMFEEDFQNCVEHIFLAKRADLCLLACGDLGKGALADVELIAETVLSLLKNI